MKGQEEDAAERPAQTQDSTALYTAAANVNVATIGTPPIERISDPPLLSSPETPPQPLAAILTCTRHSGVYVPKPNDDRQQKMVDFFLPTSGTIHPPLVLSWTFTSAKPTGDWSLKTQIINGQRDQSPARFVDPAKNPTGILHIFVGFSAGPAVLGRTGDWCSLILPGGHTRNFFEAGMELADNPIHTTSGQSPFIRLDPKAPLLAGRWRKVWQSTPH
ncbi:hypothetical protein BDZ85DRAFT_270369 [Elsinoe ampelina]|uniref:Uncharacterized protein n=1 Tax=Elsinoe ampelina TaxID=302913 RepID=A0A6A6FYE5_9PEZI|nr:hypothetical protein BDZ85DRAFT_270369 [Elsinoe ampelina]